MVKPSLFLAALGAFFAQPGHAQAEGSLEQLREQIRYFSGQVSAATFTVSITLDGEVHEASVNQGESFGQAAQRFVSRFDVLSAAENEPLRMEIASAVARGMTERHAAVQQEPAERIVRSLEVVLETRQTVLTQSENQTAEKAALAFVVRHGLNRDPDVDRYLRMFVRELHAMAGKDARPLPVDAGVQAVVPITLTLAEAPDASAQYNFYIVQGETVQEAVEGFMARLGLDGSDGGLRGDLIGAAEGALRNAEEARQLKSGQGSPGTQATETAGLGAGGGDLGRGGENGLAAVGGDGGDAAGAGAGDGSAAQAGTVKVLLTVDGVDYTLQAGTADDALVSAGQFFGAIAARPEHEASLAAMSAPAKVDMILQIAQGVARAIFPDLSSNPLAQAAGPIAVEIAPFVTTVPLMLGKNGAQVDIDPGMHLPSLAHAVCRDERQRFLADSAVTQDGATFDAGQLGELFASADGSATPLCSGLVLDVFQEWFRAEATSRISFE